jgi:hypothetical protein
MRKLHDSIETIRTVVQVTLDTGDKRELFKVDQIYVSESGKHVIIRSVLPGGGRMVETFTNVTNLVIVGDHT